MTFNPEYAPSGFANEDFTPATVDGRATCITAVLKVNGGETIGFVDNLAEVFGSTGLYFAVLEFSDSPLSNSTLSFPGTKSTDTLTDEKRAACGNKWLQDDHTLQNNTRYLIIAFKNGDENVDFTTEQLAKLPLCLEIK